MMSGDQTDANPGTGARGHGYGRHAPSPPPPAFYDVEHYEDLDDRDFEYHMKHRSRGIAIIINNDTFSPESKMSARTGSSVDRDNLVKALQYLNFKDIVVRDNLSSKQMVDLMHDAAGENYKDRDCLFVAILSHGDDGNIYGTDRAITFDVLMEPLKSKQAPTLVGKPKIFVVQACRGDKLDSGSMMTTDALPPSAAKQYLISKESDFLIAYSVVPGYYSWRNTTNGSWFIQAFCEVMLRDGRRLELIQILTRVNRMVSYTFRSNAASLEMTNKKQSPCITSMLTKSLYFV